MRPTTKRRVIILASAAVLGSLALAGVYEFRQYQISAKTMAYRAEGMDAFAHGDFAKALVPLSKYNERHQKDAETLFAFGKARSRVEAPNNRHLAEAISYFRRGLELQPDNMEARHQLLDLYSSTGYNAEAITLADELLKKDAKDVGAMRTKAKALAARHQFAEAFAASTQLNTLAPMDIEGQGLSLYLMSPWCLNKPAGEILDRAKKNLAAHPDDARFVMLMGLAYHCGLDDVNAKEQYLKAASNPPADPEFVKICTSLMDEVGLFDKSQELLERASADGKDPRMLRMLVQRLWQNGRYPQVVERLKDLDATTTATDSQLLAYKAFSLYNLQKNADAKPIVDALADRKDDDVALAWAKALSARFENPDANPREKISQYQAALVRDPGNSAVRHMMGEAYASLGETELALQAWAQVIRDVPSWPRPRVQVAYLLAASGRTQTAVEQATQAYVAGKNLGSMIGLVVARNAQLDTAGATRPDMVKVLELAGEIQQKVPGEPQTLPIYVNLLARTGDAPTAVATIQNAIAKNYPVGVDSWLRLASVSHSQKLGQERAILDHTLKTYGQSPKLALGNALLLSESGDVKGGLALLTDAAAKATANQSTWKITVAQYRENTRDRSDTANDTKVHDVWVELGDQFPQDLAVQSTIIDLPDNSTAWQDRPFIERTIQRLHALTGDQGFHWQLARCRWLLSSPDKERDSAEAVVTLSDIVRGSPGLVVPRLYLAKAMENVKNPSAAIEQLRTAAELDRDNTAIAMDLVRLLQADGKFADAKVYLDRAAQGANDSNSRQRLALNYARQGDLDTATKVMETVPTEKDPSAAALLADLYRRKGDFDRATKLYTQVVARPDADEYALAAAADYFASHGKMETARGAIDRLSQLKLPAGHREVIVAEFTEKHDSKETAAGLFRQAVDAAPTDPLVWRQLVSFQLRQNQFDEAAKTCDAALAKIPGNADFVSLKNQAVALRTTANGGTVDTNALIAELAKTPGNEAARDSLATYNETQKNNDSPDRAVQKMRRVADQYPRFLPVQTQVVRMYLQQGKTTEAITVAARAMENFPNDPEPASLATIVYASTGRWNDVVSAAQEWRKRSLENPVQPDLAIARAQIELNQPATATQVLKPYMDAAKQDPDKYNMVIGTYAQALIADNHESDAAALLSPFLTRSDEWRTSTLRLSSGIHGATATAKWINQVAPAVPADSLKGQYEVANAWYSAGLRLQHPEFFANARDVITPLTKRPDATAGVMLMAGSTAEFMKDADTAIADYRRALAIDPKQPLAQNNLANLLLAKGTDLEEARQLAEQAVAARPTEADYYDTLASVYDKSGKSDRAIATFQKVLDLQPNNVQAMFRTIRLLRDGGRRDAARAMMTKLETVLQNNPRLQTPDIDVQALRQQL